MQLSVIIAAMDETATLSKVLAQVRRLEPYEVIVVANGPSDAAAALAARWGARVLRYPDRVGHDVGRGLGAAEARGDALLFLDADLPLPALDLEPFVAAVLGGVDVALNRIDAFIHPQARMHPVNAAKRFLGCTLRRPDLGFASLTAIPHALSRRAVAELGTSVLAVPPLALARAVLGGLRVEAVHAVDVVGTNARRPGVNLGLSNPVADLILGDHLEAIDWVLRRHGAVRGPFGDLGRRRELLSP